MRRAHLLQCTSSDLQERDMHHPCVRSAQGCLMPVTDVHNCIACLHFYSPEHLTSFEEHATLTCAAALRRLFLPANHRACTWA